MKLKVFCEAEDCEYNEDGECKRPYEYVNIDMSGFCEDYSEMEEHE